MHELAESRRHVEHLAARVRVDRFAHFPAWAQGRPLDDLASRPLFIVGAGFGEASFLGRRDLDVRGRVDGAMAEYFVDGALWHLGYPLARRLGIDRIDAAPGIMGTLRAGAVRLAAAGMRAQLREPRRLSTATWLETARRTPGSLSILVTQGPEVRRLRRLARDAGIEALTVTEALRTPAFAALSAGQFNDLLGEIPTRLDQWLALEDLLDDDRSVRVLHAVLAYRLTLDLDELDPIIDYPWREYFASGLFKLGGEEVLFDVGAFTGDTLTRFLDATAGRYRGAVCLEPDEKNFFFLKKLCTTLSDADRDRVVLRQQGAWREKTTLRFLATGDTGARIETGEAARTVSISVTTIDALSEELGAPTLVKCDAEGADREVLEGGARTFGAHRSRVAVSAYHLQDDLLALPARLRAANPTYRLALRQYFPGHWDTVLYAY